MAVCDYLISAASGIYADIGQPPSLSVGYITGWLYNSYGKLNLTLFSCFMPMTGAAAASGCFNPEIDPSAMEVYSLIFKQGYYETASNNILSNYGAASSNWTTLKEGDTAITRASIVDFAKLYEARYKDATEQIHIKANLYKIAQATPQAINDITSAIYGSPDQIDVGITI